MKGGEISGNQAQGNGGGVYNNKTFTMEDGTISRNRTNGFGGGVYNNKTFTMEDGTISGNHAVVAGGGVFTNGTFMMNSGVIYGQEDDEPPEDWMKNSDGGGDSAYADAALGTSADYTINQYPEEEP
jgi:hypothetical protein